MTAKDSQHTPSPADGDEADSLFPLPLSPIEVCWLKEDCPSHPMQYFLRLHLDGHLRRDAFERALSVVLDRHPLFSAVVRKTSRCRWDWIVPGRDDSSPSLKPLVVKWESGNPDEMPQENRIDIQGERGLGITVVEGAESSCVFLQFHHAVCDGLSASDLAGDLLTAFASQLDEESSYKFKRLDPSRLKIRNDSGWTPKQKWEWWKNGILSLLELRRFYKRRPIFLVDRPNPPEEQKREIFPEGMFHRFSREESVSLNQRAREVGTNVNGLMLACLFSSFAGWRCRNDEATKDEELFRVSVPVSLRGPSHRAVPAANIVSLVCFDRTVGDTRDRDDLLRWVTGTFEQTVKENRGHILPTALRLLQKWPDQLADGIRLAAGIRRERFSGTTLFSNLGPVLINCHLPKVDGGISIGELTVTGVEFLPVLRPGHCATIGACTYGGRIAIGMHFDSRMISSTGAEELFKGYVEELLRG